MDLLGKTVMLKDGSTVLVERRGYFFPETGWYGHYVSNEMAGCVGIEFDDNDVFSVFE